MHSFYSKDILETSCLCEEESFHAVKVLRLKEGDSIRILDGEGNVYEATIAIANQRKCIVNSIQRIENECQEKPYYLHLAVAPTKNIDRYEWFIEKAAEIGVDEITPIICHFSERKVLKTERLDKILVSAMKQSLANKKVKLNEATALSYVVKNAKEELKFIGHCHEGKKVLLSKALKKQKSVLVMIGPEGDFSLEEVEYALSNGFKAISLGDKRLRVETAALYACSINSIINEK